MNLALILQLYFTTYEYMCDYKVYEFYLSKNNVKKCLSFSLLLAIFILEL